MSYLPEGGAYKEESRRGEPSRSAPSLFNLKSRHYKIFCVNVKYGIQYWVPYFLFNSFAK